MKYAIVAVSLLAVPPAWAGSTIPTFDAYDRPAFDQSYQPPSYQQRFDPPKYDDDYYRSRGALGPSIGDRFGNHLDSGWGGR